MKTIEEVIEHMEKVNGSLTEEQKEGIRQTLKYHTPRIKEYISKNQK